MTETRPGPPASPAGHPDLDALADLDAGVLDPAESARLRAHLSGCDRCRAVLAGIAEVPGILRELPPVRMPAAVEARIFAALDAERRSRSGSPPAAGGAGPGRPAGSGVASLAAARAGRRRLTRPMALAAAGLVLVVGAGVTTLALRSTTHPSSSNAEHAAGGPAAAPQGPSPLPAYDRESVTRAPLLVQILNGERGPLSADTGGSAVTAGTLRDCGSGVARQVPGVGPVPAGAEHIRFEGQAAYLLVYRVPRRLVVVAEDCSAAAPGVLYSQPY